MSSRLVLIAACCSLATACNETPSPDPSPGTASPSATASAAATTATTATQPTDSKIPPDTWLLARKDGVELGVIELRKGKRPKLTPSQKSDAATALAARLDAVAGPDGIGLDMHLPPPDGKGRGPLGTRIVKWDSEHYRYALEQKLEPEFDVKELPFLPMALPPAQFSRLNISHGGKRVGTIDFSTRPPKLTKTGDTAETMRLTNDFERINSEEGLRVRFHYAKDGAQTLMDVSAKPGDPNHAQVAALYLMVERSYQPRYTYALEFAK